MPKDKSQKPRQVITERDIIRAWREQKSKIVIPTGMLITPAARDAAKARKIQLIDETAKPDRKNSTLLAHFSEPTRIQSIAIGSDHGGYQLKEQLKDYLRQLGYRFEDVGTFSEASVDYPDIAEAVAQKVASGAAQRGVLIDGAGVGSAISANKVPGVRAAACYDVYTARNSREHNNANVLSLGSRNLGIDVAKEILKIWLETDFGGGRHLRRVEKITEIEKKYSVNR